MDGRTTQENRYDAVIAGAGPAGSYSAYRLALTGMKVLLVDRKYETGQPVQCAGLVNSSLFDLKGTRGMKEKVVLKAVYGADLYSPSGEILPLRAEKVKAYSIDRSLFDKELLRMATAAGVEVILGNGVENIVPDGSRIRLQGVKEDISADLIIGADGPASVVRRFSGLSNPQETIPGVSMECVVNGAAVPSRKVGVFTGSFVARGFFAWAIPSFGEDGVRLGLSAVSGKDIREGISQLLKDDRLASFLSMESVDEGDISTTGYTFGGVPMGSPDVIHRKRTLLIGDSAGMAKPTSGGGILPAMRAVDLFSSMIEESGYEGSETISRFSREWSSGYGKELSRSMTLRRIIRELPDRDMDKAVGALNDEKKLRLINETGDIDRPIPLAIKLLKTDPSLMRLIPRYIPHLMKLLR